MVLGYAKHYAPYPPQIHLYYKSKSKSREDNITNLVKYRFQYQLSPTFYSPTHSSIFLPVTDWSLDM